MENCLVKLSCVERQALPRSPEPRPAATKKEACTVKPRPSSADRTSENLQGQSPAKRANKLQNLLTERLGPQTNSDLLDRITEASATPRDSADPFHQNKTKLLR